MRKYKCTPEAILQLIQNQSAYPWGVFNKDNIVIAIYPNFHGARTHEKANRKNLSIHDVSGVIWEVVYN